MSFIKRADARLLEIKERANKELKQYGEKYREVHSEVMNIHTDRINGENGPAYMKKCLEQGIVENTTLVADYIADKDPEFAVAVMGLALTESAANVAQVVCDPNGWAHDAYECANESVTPRTMIEQFLDATMKR